MGSTGGNPNNPWGQYDSYKDCSQGVCSVYCPQWCYVIFPPPPSFFFDDEDESSSSDFSPLLIALIGILASAFILVSYYTLISKYCNRRRQISTNLEVSVVDSWQRSNGEEVTTPVVVVVNGDGGLDESLIKSIKVYRFKKGDGFVESSDCSVCLSEFEEDENLRLLPKCNHAFHLPCIDTWLKSHSNCPLCRSFITAATDSVIHHPISTESDSVSIDLEDSSSVIVNVDLETGSEVDKPPEEDEEENRRSESSVVLISDILREIDDDDEDEEEVGSSSSRRLEEGDKTPPPPSSDSAASGGKSSFLVRSSMAMKRSVSNGKFVISRNYRLPN